MNMFRNLIKERPCIAVVLFCIWVLHILFVFIWLSIDANALTYDSHMHFMRSIRIFEHIKHNALDMFTAFAMPTDRHPPLVMIVTALFYFVFGVGQDTAVLINGGLSLGVLIFSVYKIGAHHADKKTGLLAAYLITMYPVVFNQLKVYMLDLPLTAIVALSMYLLIKSAVFRNYKYTVAFGFSLVLGMLIKMNFVFFLTGPVLYTGITYYREYRRGGISFVPKKTMLYVCLFVIMGICLLPYYAHLPEYPKNMIISIIRSFAHGAPAEGLIHTWPTPVVGGLLLHKIRAVLWYVWGMINWQMSGWMFIIFVVGWFLCMRYSSREKALLNIWLFSSLLLVSVIIYGVGINMQVTAVRYTMPLLPACAVITALGLRQIPWKHVRAGIILGMTCFSLIQLIYVSYPVPLRWFPRKVTMPVMVPENIQLYGLFPEYLTLYDLDGWAVSGRDMSSYPRYDHGMENIYNEICAAISSWCDEGMIRVVIIPDATQLWGLAYKAYKGKKPYEIMYNWRVLSFSVLQDEEHLREFFLTADIVIDKAGGWQGEAFMLPVVERARATFTRYHDRFNEIARIEGCDDADIIVYGRKYEKNE